MDTSQPRGPGKTGFPHPRARPISAAGGAWLAWSIAAGAYLLAIFHRMALGVAALDAEAHFHTGPAAVAALSAVGLGAYLGFQVPAGLWSDRIGPRRALAFGLAVMAAGEALFALSLSLPLSLLGRAMVGAGDAFIFLNVLRVAAHWFPRERFAQLTAASAALGTLGQIVSTVPLSRGLDALGWAPTFGLTAAVTAAAAVVVFLALRERPPGQVATPRHEHAPVLQSLRRAWGRPTTRDGFWVHLTAMAPFIVVTGLWGVPILVDAQGMSRTGASFVLLIGVATSGVAALLIGARARRDPAARYGLVLRTSLAVIVALAVFTLVPADAMPPALSVVCVAVIASGMGAGMLGFDFARREGDHHDGASTSALVNLGGFSTAIVGIAAVAVLRSVLGPDSSFVLLPTLAIAGFGYVNLRRRPGFDRRSRGLRGAAGALPLRDEDPARRPAARLASARGSRRASLPQHLRGRRGGLGGAARGDRRRAGEPAAVFSDRLADADLPAAVLRATRVPADRQSEAAEGAPRQAAAGQRPHPRSDGLDAARAP